MAINITYYSEIIDNFGRTESSAKGNIIFQVLMDPENFTDDMTFFDDKGIMYYIEDLIGKEVHLQDVGTIIVPI